MANEKQEMVNVNGILMTKGALDDRLRAQQDAIKGLHDTMDEVKRIGREKLEECVLHIIELKDALHHYGNHSVDCATIEDEDCDCGYAEVCSTDGWE